jgi:hypothetical protein
VLLASVSPHHAITAGAAVAMLALAVIGLTYRATQKRLWFAWDALGILFLYVTVVALLYDAAR